MNKCFLKFVLTIGAVFGVCVVLAVGQAQADLMGPYTGPAGDKNFDAAFFSGLPGTPTGTTIVELDKDEFNDGVPDQDLEGYLFVDIDNDDDRSAKVWWDLTGTDLEARYVAVKDGNPSADGIYWVWYEVTEAQRIIGEGYVDTYANGAGAISNVALYGIPDPSIMLLLGSACLLGFAGLRRRLSR
jgi:hypothetical protein